MQRLAQRARHKNIKITPAIGGARPQKRIFFLFWPPLVFCFQKQKRNCNVKRIKNLQKYTKKSLHPHLRLTLCMELEQKKVKTLISCKEFRTIKMYHVIRIICNPYLCFPCNIVNMPLKLTKI